MASENGQEKVTRSALSSTPRPPPAQRRQLPGWLNHFNALDLKTLFRCWLAAWISMLLIFIRPSFDAIGIAAFLGAILLFIAPPAGTVFVYLLAALSIMIGMCLAWAWGLLTMKAAMAARPTAENQSRVAALRDAAGAAAQQTGQSPAWEAQVLVHDGFMLDARVTAVYYIMGCIFIYVVSRVRCTNPKLLAMQIFSIIVTDIFILVGPTLPAFMATLCVVIVKPAAIGIGLGLACCLLIFPLSTSYVVLDQLQKLTRMSGFALTTTQNRLRDDEDVPLASLKAMRGGIIAMFKASQPNLAFLPLDLSRGRLGADDVQGLHRHVRDLATSSLYLIDFHIARVNAAQMTEEDGKKHSDSHESSDFTGLPERNDGYQIGQRHRREARSLVVALQRPEHDPIRSQTRKTLQSTTADILQLGVDGVDLAARYISSVNESRWIRKAPQSRFDELTAQLRATIPRLRAARDECITSTSKGVLEAHAELFDKEGNLKPPEGSGRPFLSSMVIAMVFEERILAVTNALEKLLEDILELSQTRTTPRMWLPCRLQYALSWVFNGRSAVPASGDGGPNEKDPDDESQIDSVDEQTKEARCRLEAGRGHQGSSASRRGLSPALVATYRWLTNPAGMYALRMVIVTVATSIPASIPHSAGFFYREKGIWAVISAQTVLVVYMADFTFSVIARVLGTIIGGLVGMVTWYIGAGSGPGNPYGMAAITAVMIVPIIWMRLFLPPAFAIAVIMGGATFALVVGFSWDQDHTNQYGLPGKGYAAFWKRIVTVLLGFVASLIVQVFPKPPSATNHVRKTLANSVRTLSDHYALLLSHSGRRDENAALGTVAAQISLELAESLAAIDPSIALLRMEPTFGPFDQAVLRQTQELCQYMNQALGGLLKLASTLPPGFQERLALVSGIQDDRTIGDIMAVLAIVEQALRTGSPLPERLPAPLVRRAVESMLQATERTMLSSEQLQDENHRRYCVAVTLYLKFLTSIDDLVLVLKSALGERHVIYQWGDV
ncbi:hypothetical protein ACHAQH_008124 [Verticillium albo-atrum]